MKRKSYLQRAGAQLRNQTTERNLELYSPHPGQLQMHQSQKRYRLGAWGRQSGKSTFANNELAKHGWETDSKNYWFISPTFSQAKVQYRRMVSALFDSPQTMLKKNQTEHRIKLLSQSSISYKSGESFDSLRGETLAGAIIDEVRDQSKDLWPMVVRPMLSTTKGWGAFIGTPNGYDHFYDMYCYAKEHPEDWDVFQHPSTINPLFTLEEYEAARNSMSEKQFKQEILAEFLDLTAGKAYWAFSELNVSTTPPWNHDPETKIHQSMPLVLGLDFNLNPMSWIIGQYNNVRHHFFKELYLENSNTQEASAALFQLLEGYRSKGVLRAEPQLIIVGDATGKSGQRAAAGQSDYDILLGMLRQKGFTYDNRTPNDNPLVKDRINTVNAKCRSADGEVFLTIDPIGCPKLINDMHRVVWKDQSNILDKTRDTSLTHMSDAMGYPIHRLSPIKAIKDVGELLVVQW